MSENTDSEEIIIATPTEVIYQQDKAAIDVQITTAKAYPRNIARAKKNATDIVTMDQETAQTCTYSVPRGGKAITGPSVHLAKILAQCWGNLRVDAKVVDISQSQITSEAVCFDLENNIAIKTQVKRSILDKQGRRFKEDMITVTGNAANSIAMRNAILSVIPRPVVDSVYKAAQSTITGDVSDDTKRKKKARQVVDKLMGTFNVTEAEVLSSVGKASIDFVDADDIATLVGIGTALKDGDTTVDLAFRRNTTSDNPTQGQKSEEVSANRLVELINSSESIQQLDKRVESFSEEERKMHEALILAKKEELIKE
jgi:hypothetical protein